LEALGFFSWSLPVSIGTSIDSLLRSPCELLISRLRLAKLDRRRPNAVDVKEAGLGNSFDTGGILACGLCGKALSRVMVEVLLVREGTPSMDMRTSGPGSPIKRDL
jgi:hypothetical protein